MRHMKAILIIKISSNDAVPLIYLPKEARRLLGLNKGDRLMVYVDVDNSQLILEKTSATKAKQLSRRKRVTS